MPREYHFWVYILSSRSRNLYIGMTNNLIGRTATHREQVPGTHTGQYLIHRLVYFEYFRYVRSAIAREKELKKWTRAQKIELIERSNPTWEDLFATLTQPSAAPGLKTRMDVRSIEKCITLLPEHSPATIDEDFAHDVEEALAVHRESLDPPTSN